MQVRMTWMAKRNVAGTNERSGVHGAVEIEECLKIKEADGSHFDGWVQDVLWSTLEKSCHDGMTT